MRNILSRASRNYYYLPNMTFYIYRITNKLNGKIYIGQTNNFDRRWTSHKSSANNNPYCLIDIKIKQYGEDNFSYELIESCDTLEEANYQEEWYIKILCAHVSTGLGYNVDNGGKVNKTSEETRKKQSISHLWKIIPNSVRKKISESLMGDKNHFFGKQHTPETIKQLKEAHTGEKHNWFGKKLSPASLEKRSQTMGAKHSEFCSIENCGKKYYSKGYCHIHYNQYRIKNNETIKM